MSQPTTSTELAWEHLQRSAREAYLIARGERLAELRGRRPRTFDDRGLHPYSYVAGEAAAYARGLGDPELVELAWPDPLALRAAARIDAEREHRERLLREELASLTTTEVRRLHRSAREEASS